MKKKTKEKKKKSRLTSLIQIVIIVFLGVCALSLGSEYFGFGKSDNVIAFTIEEGATTSSISESLKENGIIKYPTFFKVMSKISGYDGKYKEGIFNLNKGMGYGNIFDKLSGTSDYFDDIQITIPEGCEFRQIADILEKNGLIDREKFYKIANEHNFDYDFLKNIPERENRLEGYLYPDTYRFNSDSTEEIILNTMLSRFDAAVGSEYKARAEELGMTLDEVITLASIIEREAQGDIDRDNVSSVFHNRLKSDTYPYLESCATVQYVLKERKPVLSIADTEIDSPYNTYINPGLPIGPIASPGEKSIKAALYPADTNYLFFVLDSTGVHRFAVTYDEHIENAKK